MKRKVYRDIEQGTAEWKLLRLGKVTASEFQTTKGDKKTRTNYLRTLVGERITGEISEKFKSPVFDRGHMHEEEARVLYSNIVDKEIEQIAFISLGDEIGYSPDSLVGNDGLWECKSREPHILLALHENGKIPAKDESQCYGGLWVSDREWIDYMAYWPGMVPFIKRIYRDTKKIVEIRSAVSQFLEELHEYLEWYKKLI